MMIEDDRPAWLISLPLFFAAALSLGAPYLFIQVGSMVLLLALHGVEGLIIVYTGCALLLVPLGIGLSTLEHRFRGRTAFLFAIGFRALMAIVLFLMLYFDMGEAVAYAAAIWARMELILGPLSYWGFAARRGEMPARRDGLPWLSMAEPLSLCIGGFLAPVLAPAVGIGGLFLIAAGLLLGSMMAVLFLPSGRRAPIVRGQVAKYAARPMSPNLRSYVIMVGAAMIVWTAAHYMLDALFHGVAAASLDSDFARLTFFSLVLAAAGILSSVLLAIGRSNLMRRFGLRIIVTALPVGLLIIAGVTLGLASLSGFAVVLFFGVTLMKGVEFALVNGFYMWAWRSLFAPVPDTHRQKLKNRVYRVVHSGGAVLATAFVCGLVHLRGFEPWVMLAVFAAIAAIGIIAAQVVKQGYVAALERALRRRQDTSDLDGGVSGRRTREMIQRLLRRGDTGDAIEAARLQATLDIEGFINIVPRLIARGPADVVKKLLGTVPEIARPELYPPMAGRLSVEEDPDLRDALLTAAAATGHPRSPRMLARAMADEPNAPPMGALIGLGRHGGAFGQAIADQFLERIALSGPAALARSLEAVAAIGPAAPSSPVSLALRSEDALLRRRAIRVAGIVGDETLAPLLAEHLSDPFEWRAATLSLSKLGAGAVPVLAQTVGDRMLETRQRAAAIRALGGIDLPEAAAQLWLHARSRNRRLRQVAHLALWRCGAVATREQAGFLREYAAEDVRHAAEIMLAATDLAPLHSDLMPDLLHQQALRLLVCAIRASGLTQQRDRAFQATLAETFGARRAWQGISDGIGCLTDPLAEIARLIATNATDGPADRIQRLRRFTGQDPRTPEDWLGHILTAQTWPRDWVRAIAYYHLTDLIPDRMAELEELVEEPGPKLAATIEEIAARQTRKDLRGPDMSLTTIERVLILKSADLFAKVPEEELAEIAPYLTSVFLDPDEVIITEGEVGEELYIVVSGEVRVMKAGQELARLGEREVFGELAALDPEPRSATVMAAVPTQVLALSNEHLLALFEANVEIASGVIATLIGRLRHQSTG
ncbi:MAG: cyclic nucleotide-binding domain-containing protein [Pseudomonadota bacterium]